MMNQKNDNYQGFNDGNFEPLDLLEIKYDYCIFTIDDSMYDNTYEENNHLNDIRKIISSLSKDETKAVQDLRGIKNEESRNVYPEINDNDRNKEFNNNLQKKSCLGKKTKRSKTKRKKTPKKNKKNSDKKINNKIKLPKRNKPSDYLVNGNEINIKINDSARLARDMNKIDQLKTCLFDSLFGTSGNYSENNENIYYSKFNKKISEILSKKNLLFDISESEKDEINKFLEKTPFEYFQNYLESLKIKEINNSMITKYLLKLIDGLKKLQNRKENKEKSKKNGNLFNPSNIIKDLALNNNLQEVESSESLSNNLTIQANNIIIDISNDIPKQSIDNEKTNPESVKNKIIKKEDVRKDDLRDRFNNMTIGSFKEDFNKLNKGSYQLPAKLKIKKFNEKNNQKGENDEINHKQEKVNKEKYEKYRKFMQSSFEEIIMNFKNQNKEEFKAEAKELMKMIISEYIKQTTEDKNKEVKFYDNDIQLQKTNSEGNYYRYLANEVCEQKSLDGLILLTKIFRADKGYLRRIKGNQEKNLIAKLEEILQIKRKEEFEYDINRGKALKEIAKESIAYLSEISKK